MINKQICTTYDSKLFHWKLFISVSCCGIKKIIANSYFQIKLMLKNKLRKRLGEKKGWGCKNDRSTPDSDLLAAEETQVKGHFLNLLKQEVRIMLWFRHCNASGRSLPTAAPEAPMVSRQYPDKSKHCSVASTSTVRPRVELHGTCYSVSSTIIWAKAKNNK